MPEIIRQSDIIRYREDIKRNDVQGVIRVYSELLDKGYDYAGWARGVAAGNTVTGEAAILFMQDSSGRRFSESELNTIRVGMARAYLDVLETNMNGTGQTRQDAKFEQIREFHEKVFIRHGLTIGNWTLEEPMRLLGKYGNGKETQDRIWNELARTQGDGFDAVAVSTALYLTVADFADGQIQVDKNGRYLPVPQPSTPYHLPVYGQTDGIRRVDAADRNSALRWLADAAQWRSLSKTFADAQDIAERQIMMAQNRPEQPFQTASLTPYAQAAMENGRACFVQFCDYYNIDYPKDRLDNIAAAIAAHSRAEDMRDVSRIDVDGDSVFIGHFQPDLVTAEFSLREAINTPVQESMQQLQEAENRLLQEELERQMTYEQDRGRGMSRS